MAYKQDTTRSTILQTGLWTLALEDVAPESLRVAALLALTRGADGFAAEPAQLAGLIQPRTAPTLTVTALRLMARRPPDPQDVTLACRALASDSEEVLDAAVSFLEERGDRAAAGPLRDVADDPTLPARIRKYAQRIAERLSPPAATLGVHAVAAVHEGRA